MEIGWNELDIPEKRRVLYRNFADIQGRIYLVEVSRDARNVFFMLFPNHEKPKDFFAEKMNEKQAMKLMAENQNNFETLVKRLYVKFGKL